MRGITGLGHVAIRVRDVDRTLDFYDGKLGLAELLRLHHDDGRLWLVYLRITDDHTWRSSRTPRASVRRARRRTG